MNCDKEKGTCTINAHFNDNDKPSISEKNSSSVSFLYFGDPMCSWCWGGAETFSELERLCENYSFEFNVITGGLRAGGGDIWNEEFRSFLRKEWEHISSKTGQEFTYRILNHPNFDYDTEPACRAVNTARKFLGNKGTYSFFKKVQEKFYVGGEDPKEIGFYQEICENFSIPFNEFQRVFNDKKTKAETVNRFSLCREWGVRSFPTVYCVIMGEIHPFINGYFPPEEIDKLIKDKVISLLNGRGNA